MRTKVTLEVVLEVEADSRVGALVVRDKMEAGLREFEYDGPEGSARVGSVLQVGAQAKE